MIRKIFFTVLFSIYFINIFAQQVVRSTIDLIPKDTLTNTNAIVLVDDVYKFHPKLHYKYRLDSIDSEINLDYNEWVQKQIDVFETKRKKEIQLTIEKGSYYFPIFEKALKHYQIPLQFKYLPIIESSMNPFAVSKSGAVGLWQFMFTTGKLYGLEINDDVDERRDPVKSSYAAARYLREAFTEFNDWLLALASYNSGMGNVRRAIMSAGGGKQTFWSIYPYLSDQTKNYVPAFIAANYMMNYHHLYPDIKPIQSPNTQFDAIQINKNVYLQDIAEVLNIPLTKLKELNPMYKKDTILASEVKPRRLVVPKSDLSKYDAIYTVLNKGVVPVTNNNRTNVTSSTSAMPAYINYQVKAGDTLTSIASKFSLNTVESLMQINNLSSTVLSIGAVLKIIGVTIK